MNWFTDGARVRGEPAARPWQPENLAALTGDAAAEEEAPPIPGLFFDEHEVARIAATERLRERQAAEAAMDADPATRQARAMERLAQHLAEARREEVHDAETAMRQTIALAAAIARAAPCATDDAAALAARCGELLTAVAGPARLVLPPADAEELRPLMPELAARAGLADGLELEADPLLPPGAARLLWPGGWLEQDPAATAARLAALLAGHGAPTPTATTRET